MPTQTFFAKSIMPMAPWQLLACECGCVPQIQRVPRERMAADAYL